MIGISLYGNYNFISYTKDNNKERSFQSSSEELYQNNNNNNKNDDVLSLAHQNNNNPATTSEGTSNASLVTNALKKTTTTIGNNNNNAAEDELDREDMKRPYMSTTSQSILNSILDIEQTYKAKSTNCQAFGGSKFMKDLIQSKQSLSDQIVGYKNRYMDIYYAENVSLLVEDPHDWNKIAEDKPTIYLQLPSNSKIDRNYKTGAEKDRDGSTLKQMMKFLFHSTKDTYPEEECTHYIEYPVLLVDHDIDSNNWWFLLLSLLKHYITLGVVQPNVTGNYNNDNLRVLHTIPDGLYFRAFMDSFEFMFQNRRGRDSRQIWHTKEESKYKNSDNNSKRYCFRKLVWSPGAMDGGSDILLNRRHPYQNCFSSIIYSYAAHLKASLGIPTLPRPGQPRVVWVGRNMTETAKLSDWQKKRLISNQDEITKYLLKKCSSQGIEFQTAEYYKEGVAYEEQANFASRFNIMMGIHGAGLNMFHFMPFHSIVIEIHIGGTTAQRNSANFVTHTLENKYVPHIASKKKWGQKNAFAVEPIWSVLKQAIQDWKTLPQDIHNNKNDILDTAVDL